MNEQPALTASPVVAARDLHKVYRQGRLNVPVLLGVNLTVQRGERVAIVGASGSGKSTLLHLLGGLDQATSGSVTIMGEDIARLSEAQRGQLRNRAIGFVYQFHHLLAEFSALENVAMPLLIRRMPKDEAYERAAKRLHDVRLGKRLSHHPGELSGGERQRTAIARALVTEPACLFADEPTGNLDRRTADGIQDLMLEPNQSLGTSFLVVSHDASLAGKMERVLKLEDGTLAPADAPFHASRHFA